MSKNHDLIATVDIDLKSPIVDESSFDNLLIVGPLPKAAPKETPNAVGEYSSIDEVVAAGWSIDGDAADPVGVAARVAFSQVPRPSKIYIAPIMMVNGTDGSEAELAVRAVERAIGVNGWYVVCTAGVDSSEYNEIANFIEKQEKIFCYTELDCFESETAVGTDVLCRPVVGNEYFRTMWIFGRETRDQKKEDIPANNLYMNVAMAATWLHHQSGSETAVFKQLSNVHPSKLTEVEVAVLEKNNGNFCTTIGNMNVTLGGKVCAGEWADVIRFRDWQKNDMQISVANLFLSVPKVPYSDSGIALVQNQMVASLRRGQDRGGIAEDEFDEFGNTIYGFTTSVPASAAIPTVEKTSRKLRGLKFKARLAGAIHFAELDGSMTYEL